MSTQCTPIQLEFPRVGRRRVVARFNGGAITSNAGALLLQAVESCTQVCRRAARCFQDHRDGRWVEHTVEELVTQRVVGLALGYEDVNDHDTLRRDALVAAVVGKADPTRASRVRAADRGAALAGKSTLNRLELAGPGAETDRYKKVSYDAAALDALLVDLFVEAHPTPPTRIVLDVDATDDPLHGQQEGRFFHGYYRHYCYLPLYVFCGAQVLCARLRPANWSRFRGHLSSWEKEVSAMPKTRPPYPAVFRQQMVELVRSGRTPGELAREFEPSAQAIRNWVAQAGRDGGERADGLRSEEGEERRRAATREPSVARRT